MRSITRIVTPALAVGLLALAGCEKADPSAPTDSIIVVTASPGNIPLDTLNQNGEAQSTITAEVFDADGAPKSGVAVRFSTDVGRMASGGDGIKTGGDGTAKDKLVVTENDAETTATVTASSGSIAGTVDVTIGMANEAPTALFSMTPNPVKAYSGACPVPAGGSPLVCVFFDGREGFSGSQDPDGRIASYKWTLAPQIGPVEVVEGPDPLVHGSFFRGFADEQTVTVTLQVTDDFGATGIPTADVLTVLGNLPPLANAGIDTTVNMGNTGNPASAVVSFDALNSSDPDGVIVGYRWDYGEGTISGVLPNQPSNNSYEFPGTYIAVVRVFDNGNGVPASSNPPNFWEYQDGKFDEDTRQVVIVDPTP